MPSSNVAESELERIDTFKVSLERYTGPYFKILELIDSRKLSINEFSLAEITDEYLSFIKRLESSNSKNVGDISEFIVTASTLMLIKARSLFPNIVYTEEEKKEVGNLEKKLELYKIMQDSSKHISDIFFKNSFTTLPKPENKEVVFVYDERLEKSFLHSIAIATILKFPKIEKIKQVAVKQILKIEDVIDNLLARVNLSSGLSFRDFGEKVSGTFKTFEERKNAFVVSFLAMLELIKNGVLDADQDSNEHNQIFISKQNPETGESKIML